MLGTRHDIVVTANANRINKFNYHTICVKNPYQSPDFAFLRIRHRQFPLTAMMHERHDIVTLLVGRHTMG
jgi:hypothetical protein